MLNLNRRHCLLGLLALGGCAQLPTPKPVLSNALFRVNGRFQVRHPPPLLTGSFVWTHFADYDRWDVYSPLQTWLATLTQSANLSTIQLANGQQDQAPSASILSERWLGIALPLLGMPWWLQGIPMREKPFVTHARGFSQEDWDVQIVGWLETSPQRPRELLLTHPALVIRCLLSDWE